MKHLRYLAFLMVFAFFADVVAVSAQTISTSASQQSPFSFGLVGNIARHFPTGQLAAALDLPRFPTALNEHNGITLGGGIEALYRLNPAWELAFRGEYAQASATTTGEENVPLSVWNPQLSRYQPILTSLRNTLTSNISLLSFTPLVRLFFGDIFFASIGARFDVPLQASLRYRFDIAAPAAFISTFSQRIDTALRFAPAARLGLSPVVSIGASIAVGRVRFVPELQVQPLFQSLRGLTPENTPWNLASLRFNLGIIFTFPTAKTDPIPPSAVQNTSQSASQNNVQNSAQRITTNPGQSIAQSSSQEASVFALQTIKADTLPVLDVPVTFPVRLDTVFQRDTTTRIVAWNLSDTVRLEGKTTQSRVIPSGRQFAIAESYTHDVPKPKPFLVANLDVRFIPILGAPRSAETQQAARLVEKPMIVRSLAASVATQETFSLHKTYDTLNIVRLPLVRFLPTISSEVGMQERLISIGTERSAQEPLLTIVLPNTKPLDWDAQALLLSPRPANGNHTLIGDTLAVWMTVTDNEKQRIKTGVSRITVEHFDAATATQQATARTKQPVVSWTLASFRVVANDSVADKLFLADEAIKLREYMLGEMARRKAQSKTSFKNCTVYGVLPASADAGTSITAKKTLESLFNLTRSLAEAFRTSSFYVIQSGMEPFANNSFHVPPMQHFDKKTYAFPRTDAYIRVMVEE